MKVEDINPYGHSARKGEQVEQMFNSIAPHYDFMNTAMSFGQHKRWRNIALKKALSYLPTNENLKFLDLATGTGDVAFRLHDIRPHALVTGIDLSEGMLEIARRKLSEMDSETRRLIAFGKGDSLALPFHNSYFNLVTVAYGVRNFQDLRKGLTEIRRVLTPEGVACIIELSTPQGLISKSLYKLYSGKIIPWIGKRVSGDDRAYSYLPESIEACPQRENMAALLYAEGFSHVEWHSLSFGALTYYVAK